MNIRSVMLVSALCVLGWSIWGLINLPDWVLAQRLPNRELPVKLAEGYAVLRHLWPVLAFGILLGGGLLAGLFRLFYQAQMKQRAEQEQQHTEALLRQAQQEQTEALYRLNQQQMARQIEANQARDRALEQWAEEQQCRHRAESALNVAVQEAAQWRLRACNAICAAERVKQKARQAL